MPLLIQPLPTSLGLNNVQYLMVINVQAADGTFIEEPGSGAVATIENKNVSVGNLEWVRR